MGVALFIVISFVAEPALKFVVAAIDTFTVTVPACVAVSVEPLTVALPVPLVTDQVAVPPPLLPEHVKDSVLPYVTLAALVMLGEILARPMEIERVMPVVPPPLHVWFESGVKVILYEPTEVFAGIVTVEPFLDQPLGTEIFV